jgi:hypothetical protein
MCAIAGSCVVPVFAVDSNSLLAPRKPVDEPKDTFTLAEDWLSSDIFELLFDEALSTTYADEAFEKSLGQWEETCVLKNTWGKRQEGFSVEQWVDCLQKLSETVDARPPLTVQWTALQEALDCFDTSQLAILSDLRVYSAARWSAQGCKESLLSIDWMAFPLRWVGETLEAHAIGLLSPLQVVEALYGLVALRRSSESKDQSGSFAFDFLRESLRRTEYARYVSLHHNKPFKELVTNLRLSDTVPWFNLLPSTVVSRLRKFSVLIDSSRVVYPYNLHTANTSNTVFNTIQTALVRDGMLPIVGAQLRFWLMFLMANLPSLDVAISTAYTEICTYCRVRIDAADSDQSYTYSIALLHGVVECMDLFEAVATKLVESKQPNVLNLKPILSELERTLAKFNCASS